MKSRQKLLTDEQWELIEPLLAESGDRSRRVDVEGFGQYRARRVECDDGGFLLRCVRLRPRGRNKEWTKVNKRMLVRLMNTSMKNADL